MDQSRIGITDEDLLRDAMEPAVEARHAGPAEDEEAEARAVSADVQATLDKLVERLEREGADAREELDAAAASAKLRAAGWAAARTFCQSASGSLLAAAVPMVVAGTFADVAAVAVAMGVAVLLAVLTGVFAALIAFLTWMGGAPASARRGAAAEDRADAGVLSPERARVIEAEVLGLPKA